MSDDKTRKQLYLKENILNGGHDAVAFGQFMASQKEDGTDINNWTLPDLQVLVSRFIEMETTGDTYHDEAKPDSFPSDDHFDDHHDSGYGDQRESIDSVEKYLSKNPFGSDQDRDSFGQGYEYDHPEADNKTSSKNRKESSDYYGHVEKHPIEGKATTDIYKDLLIQIRRLLR